MIQHVLFVCTGNICRSPLAASLLERALKERGLEVTVTSAGTGAWDGAPASEGAYLVGLERGLDLSGHRARLLTRELVERADLILTMARHHRARGAGNAAIARKEAVAGSVARNADGCARGGACNTFWTEDGERVGDNTDVFGVAAALDRIGATHKGERWLVVGTGGSARATAVTAADRGATLFVRSRDASRAKAFAAWATGVGVPTTVATGGAAIEVDVAINATP